MANTLTAVIPDLQEAANTVSRELVGFVGGSFRNVAASRAGYNQTVEYSVVPSMSPAAVTPANVAPAGTDRTITAGSMVMDNLRKVSWNWEGEQRRALLNGDRAQFGDIVQQTFQQAMRALVNEIEVSLYNAAYKNASRAYGSAGSAPFGTANDLSDLSQTDKILRDNGSPQFDKHLVLSTSARANLAGKQSVIFKVNEAGDGGAMLRRGSIAELQGFMLHESGGISTHTKGTASGATTNTAGYAVGSTVISLAVAGTGTILAGDVITFNGDTNKYVVVSGDSDVSNGGSITLASPGLKQAIPTSATAITVGANYTPSVAFDRNALHLVMRAPDDGDDGAVDVVNIQDPISGLVFQLARYGQYMQSSWELRCLYGVKAVNPEHIALLLG